MQVVASAFLQTQQAHPRRHRSFRRAPYPSTPAILHGVDDRTPLPVDSPFQLMLAAER